MKKLLIILLVLLCGIACNRNKQVQSQNTYLEEMDKGWTSLGSVPTYRVGSDGIMHCCTDCARLDYQVINGETRYRICYALSAYYNVVRNPEYGSSSRYGNYHYKAGPYYLNL